MSDHLHPTDLPAPPTQTQMIPAGERALRSDLVLAGDPGPHRESLARVLGDGGWTIAWDPAGWSGMATKGSKTMNFLFGAFAQYHEISFSFVTQPDASTGLTLYRTGQGCMGGLYGMYKVKKSFKKTAGMVENHYQIAGVLVASGGS